MVVSDAVIAANLRAVRDRIAESAQRTGRDVRAIRLIAISKTHPPECVAAAVAAGQAEFGENTTQEALPKIAQFHDQALTWHFVGYVQSNKARFLPGNFLWLHSLDHRAMAVRLARFAHEYHATINALIEINITHDPRRHGVAPEALFSLLDELLRENLMPGLALRGLMAMAPYPAAESEVRAAFARVRELRDQCCVRYALPGFTELSMGMSGDYVQAIEEGATMVRIGSAIFGARTA